MKTVLLLAGAGLLYWWYSSSASAAVGAPPTTGGGTTTPPPTGTTTTPPPVPSQLASIYTAMVADSGAGTNGQLTPYQWNYSLQRVLPAGMTAPDPIGVFGADVVTQLMPATTYWAKMNPVLHSTLGLSGIRGLSGWMA